MPKKKKKENQLYMRFCLGNKKEKWTFSLENGICSLTKSGQIKLAVQRWLSEAKRARTRATSLSL